MKIESAPFLCPRLATRSHRLWLFLKTGLCVAIVLLGVTGEALADFNAASNAYVNGDPTVLRSGLRKLIDEKRDSETLRWFEQLYDGPGQGRMLNFTPLDQALLVEAVRGAVDRTREPHAMYRLSLLYQMLRNKSEERLWLSRAAAVGYVHRPSNGARPIHAKYLYGHMLGLAGEIEAALKEMEAALAAGDTEAETWLIGQYAGETPLWNTDYSNRRTVSGAPSNSRRAAELIVIRANRELTDKTQHSDRKARALEALAMVKLWNSDGSPDLDGALALFEQAWATENSAHSAQGIIDALERGAGKYAENDRRALIREWTSKRTRAELIRRPRVVP